MVAPWTVMQLKTTLLLKWTIRTRLCLFVFFLFYFGKVIYTHIIFCCHWHQHVNSKQEVHSCHMLAANCNPKNVKHTKTNTLKVTHCQYYALKSSVPRNLRGLAPGSDDMWVLFTPPDINWRLLQRLMTSTGDHPLVLLYSSSIIWILNVWLYVQWMWGRKKIKSVEEIKVPDQQSLPNYETESEYNDMIDLYHF